VEIQTALIILLVAVIIGALAVYLIATIQQLFMINAGLDVVLGRVGEIVAKSAPVNGVVDAINSNLVAGRDLLENLLLKKAGPDSAGLVESLFPGEGAKFLQRVGRTGKVVNTGAVYTRGVGILAGLGRGAPIGAAHTKGPAVRDPQYSTTQAAMLYPAPIWRRPETSKLIPKSPVIGKDPVHSPYEAALTPGTRSRDASGHKIDEAAAAPAPAAPSAPPPAAEASQVAPPPPPPAGGIQPGGRLSAKGTRPWER
jgi:hypothetical protein